MASVSVKNLTLRFPLHGVDNQSLRKQLAKMAVGGLPMALGGKVGGKGGDAGGSSTITALNNVSFELKPGDRLGLIGRNGSGKTTLLRTLAGAYEPDEGSVEVHGRIGSLLDLSLGIDPSATGIDNIYLRGLVAGLSRKEIDARIDDIGAFSGLGAFLAMPMKMYSAGMMARLAFAVTTSIEADVLVMDEWIAVGDADFREAAHTRLTQLVERARILVIASHDPELIRKNCTKVAWLEGGFMSRLYSLEEYEALQAGQAV